MIIMDGLYTILTMCMFISLIKLWHKDINNVMLWLCMTTVTLIILIDNYTKPSALDVYRNKTELKINGYYSNLKFIPTDSVVVFK